MQFYEFDALAAFDADKIIHIKTTLKMECDSDDPEDIKLVGILEQTAMHTMVAALAYFAMRQEKTDTIDTGEAN